MADLSAGGICSKCKDGFELTQAFACSEIPAAVGDAVQVREQLDAKASAAKVVSGIVTGIVASTSVVNLISLGPQLFISFHSFQVARTIPLIGDMNNNYT